MHIDTSLIVNVATSTLRYGTPLIFAATGGVISERSGVLNIALEGMILAGAFGYFVGGYLANSLIVAILFALIVGAALALVLGYLSIILNVDQVIGGMALNLAAAGATGFLYRSSQNLTANPTVPGMGSISIPGLTGIPVIGPIVFGEPPLTYLAFALVILAWLFFRSTRFGLWVRATGERPEAAEAAGIDVFIIRFAAVCVSGFLCGLGGAFILSQVQNFSEGMTQGVGFIALAAVIFGNWEPWKTMGACLLFAFFQALQTTLQVQGVQVPYQFLLMAPYIATIVVLAGFVGRSRPPAADGKPYVRA